MHTVQVQSRCAVYSCHARQKFENLSELKGHHHRFRMIANEPAVDLSPNARLAIDYLKDHLHVGTVFCMPISWQNHLTADASGGEDLALPDTLEIVPAFSDACVLTDMVDLCQAEAPTMMITAACKFWHFFRVVSTNADKRFSQRKDTRRSVQVSVNVMRISGRKGKTAQFKYGNIRILDLLSLLHSCSMAHLVNRLFVWRSESGSQLTVGVPLSHRPVTTASLMPMASIYPEEGANWDFPMEDQVRFGRVVALMYEHNRKRPSASEEIDEAVLLHSCSRDLMTEMLSKGVLIRSGQGSMVCYSINFDSLRWKSCLELERGDSSAASHASLKNIASQSKLSVIAYLCSNGWTPLHDADMAPFLHGHPPQYELDDPRIFLLKAKLSKAYFVALATAEEILTRMLSFDLPLGIHHGMKETYYRVLMNGKRDDLMSLAALLDGLDVQAILQLKDSDFKVLMSDEALAIQDADPVCNVPALEDEAPDLMSDDETLIDAAFIHRVGLAVVAPRPRSSVDISQTKTITFLHGRTVAVHFDNCSHSSGKQRCYIACPCSGPAGHHHECFKYSQVDRPRFLLYRGQTQKKKYSNNNIIIINDMCVYIYGTSLRRLLWLGLWPGASEPLAPPPRM